MFAGRRRPLAGAVSKPAGRRLSSDVEAVPRSLRSRPLPEPDGTNQAAAPLSADYSTTPIGDRAEREAESASRAILDSTRRLSTPLHATGLRQEAPRSAPAPASVRDSSLLPSEGKPLDDGLASFMASRFGHDFATVRIHDDATTHRTAAALDARAFTLGGHIGFAAGHFAPGTRAGMGLIAHELTTVVQQAGSSHLALQCAPVLSRRTPGEIIGDDDFAKDVDAALAASKTITTYVAAKDLKKAKGHFHIEFRKTFEKHLAENAKAVGERRPANTQPNQVTKGFTDLKAGEIRMREQVADVEGAVHEALHLNSKQSSNPAVSAFQMDFSNPMEEGVTQYFTNQVLVEQTIGQGSAYPDELALAEALISVLNEGPVGKAYFRGDHGARDTVLQAFNKAGANYTDWGKAIHSNDKKDWLAAAKTLKRVFGGS